MDSKYGRLFTEADVKKLLSTEMTEGDAQIAIDGFEGTFPKDEPVFVLRGQDKAAADAIEEYRFIVRGYDCSDEFVEKVKVAEESFREFANNNPETIKVPD